MFYTNNWSEVKEFIQYYSQLVKAGFEVVVATDNMSLVEYLAVGKLTVVNKNTYYPDVIVTNNNRLFSESMTLDSFKEVFL